MIKRKGITDKTKQELLQAQEYKCANHPNSNLKGLEDYLCPLWKLLNDNTGKFTHYEYHFDHIIENSKCDNSEKANIQVLCGCCHVVKTKDFMAKRNTDPEYLEFLNKRNMLKKLNNDDNPPREKHINLPKLYDNNSKLFNEIYYYGINSDNDDYAKVKGYTELIINEKLAVIGNIINKLGKNNDFVKNLIIDNKYYKNYVIFSLLKDKTEEEITAYMQNYKKNNKILIPVKTYNKILKLFKLEKLVNISRFEVSKINNNIDLDTIKKELLIHIDDIIIFFAGSVGATKLKIQIIKKINEVKYFDQLQVFYADIYNTYDNLIVYETKRKYYTFNKKRTNRQLYLNFKENDLIYPIIQY